MDKGRNSIGGGREMAVEKERGRETRKGDGIPFISGRRGWMAVLATEYENVI